MSQDAVQVTGDLSQDAVQVTGDLSQDAEQDAARRPSFTIMNGPARESRVLLANQRHAHRKWLFRCCLIICTLLYLLFFLAIGYVICSPTFFLACLEHKHVAFFILALLIIPSALLWGLVRATFAYSQHEGQQESDTSLLQTIQGIHPSA